jgi:hypothetical protein
VLKCLDERRTQGLAIQAAHTRGSSGVGSGIPEQRHAAQRVLPESELELRHAESAPEEATLEEEEWSNFFGRPVWPVGTGGVGRQEIADAARSEMRVGSGTPW